MNLRWAYLLVLVLYGGCSSTPPQVAKPLSEEPTPLMLAASRSEVSTVQKLIQQGSNVNVLTQYGTALNWAAEKNRKEVMLVLLEAGADPNLSPEKNAETPLMAAASKRDVKLVQRLLDAGAKVDARDRDGGTALGFAAHRGHMEVTELLLKKGADPNVKFPDGKSLLSYIKAKKDKKMMALLVKYGAK